jgi:hypothetical protein
MIGIALKAAKLGAGLLGSLLSRKAAQSNQPVSGNVQAENVTLGPGAVAQAPAAGVLPNVVSAATDMLGPLVAKGGAPIIQGIGGALRNVLSTMNDDEWFSHYDGNGATFNELLTSYADTATDNTRNFVALKVYGGLVGYLMSDRTEGVYYNQFMSHMLAYIRSKTNNILQDDVTTYQRVYFNVVKLYEIYYSLRKWENFMLQTPANAPTIINVTKAYIPENVNVTRGIADNLESYLKATVKLPYALASYIRWRFGTIFLTSNTKRAGFASYDPLYTVATAVDATTHDVTVKTAYATAQSILPHNNTGAATPSQIASAIEALKSQLITDGRALSDFAYAYADHEVKYDVEDRHFDEKEFCLRQNIARYNMCIPTAGPVKTMFDDGAVEILMDSRLDMNAGIQALTISLDVGHNDLGMTTGGGGPDLSLAPFPVGACQLFLDATRIPNNLYNLITGSNGYWRAINSNSKWITYFKTFQGAAKDHLINRGTLSNNTAQNYSEVIANAVEVSLEMHNANSFDIFVSDGTDASGTPGLLVQIGSLSYDRAKISFESIGSIQRNAILNLVRGDYKRKQQVDVKEEATTVVDGLTSKDVSFTKDKIDLK